MSNEPASLRPLQCTRHVLRLLLWDSWTDGTLLSLKTDVVAGITLALAQVAPAISYAIMANAQPIEGLRAAFLLAVGVSILGGRPGQIAAPAGAVSILLPDIAADLGTGALGAVAILSGIGVALVSLLGVGRFVRVLPAPVLSGFLDGLAITLAKSQVKVFRDPHTGVYATGELAGLMALIACVSFAIMMLLPRLTRAVPSTFIAIAVTTVFEQVLRAAGHRGTVTLGDLYDLSSGSFTVPRHPDVDYSGNAGRIVTASVLVVVVACLETFLCTHLLNRATRTDGNFRREGIALGVTNVVCGFLGAFPGCAIIGASLLNVDMRAGTRRLAVFVCGLVFLVVLLVAGPAVSLIPTASLAAVVFGYAALTWDWRTFRMVCLLRIPPADAVVLIVTVVMTVVFNLVVGIGVGLGCSCIFFVAGLPVALVADGWAVAQRDDDPEQRMRSRASMAVDTITEERQQVVLASEATEIGSRMSNDVRVAVRGQVAVWLVQLRGTLFFGTAMTVQDEILRQLAAHVAAATKGSSRVTDVVIDCGDGALRIADFTAAEALQELATELQRKVVGVRLHIVRMDALSLSVVRSAKVGLRGPFDLVLAPQVPCCSTSTGSSSPSPLIRFERVANVSDDRATAVAESDAHATVRWRAVLGVPLHDVTVATMCSGSSAAVVHVTNYAPPFHVVIHVPILLSCELLPHAREILNAYPCRIADDRAGGVGALHSVHILDVVERVSATLCFNVWNRAFDTVSAAVLSWRCFDGYAPLPSPRDVNGVEWGEDEGAFSSEEKAALLVALRSTGLLLSNA